MSAQGYRTVCALNKSLLRNRAAPSPSVWQQWLKEVQVKSSVRPSPSSRRFVTYFIRVFFFFFYQSEVNRSNLLFPASEHQLLPLTLSPPVLTDLQTEEGSVMNIHIKLLIVCGWWHRANCFCFLYSTHCFHSFFTAVLTWKTTWVLLLNTKISCLYA